MALSARCSTVRAAASAIHSSRPSSRARLHARFEGVDALTLPSHAPAPPARSRHGRDARRRRRRRTRPRRARSRRGSTTRASSPGRRRARRASRSWRRIRVRVGQARRFYSFRFTTASSCAAKLGDVTSHWSDILLDYARAIGCDTADRAVPRRADPRGRSAQPQRGSQTERRAVRHPQSVQRGRVQARDLAGSRAGRRSRATCARVSTRRSSSAARPPTRPFAEAHRASRRAKARVVSIAGRTGIGAFGALARRARAFVGITTGSMHVAAAVGCPTVGIFPFQSDFPDRWAPLGER